MTRGVAWRRAMEGEGGVREFVRRFDAQRRLECAVRWAPELDGSRGSGVRIALLDSGIQPLRTEFLGARIQARDFSGRGGPPDRSGHGTKSARLLVAQGGDGFWGLVPRCQLLMASVTGAGDPRRSAAALSAALLWAVAERVDIIVIPLGRSASSARVARAVVQARRQGIEIFASAGNRGPDRLLFPACLPGVVAVSAATVEGEPIPWCCQTAGVLHAPGVGLEHLTNWGRSGYSGTSPAAVIAAGVAALRLSQRSTVPSPRTRPMRVQGSA